MSSRLQALATTTRSRQRFGWGPTLWGWFLLTTLLALPATLLHADYPSRIILSLRATCMETCGEKEAGGSCSRYCDCHLFELRRDLSDSQVEQMLLTAERGGEGAESIRQWLRSSALVCEKRVFGEGAGKEAGRGAGGGEIDEDEIEEDKNEEGTEDP
jgi:hypothetical protein